MRLEHGLPSSSDYKGGFVAIGNFDGVHRGHQAMISRLVVRAREQSRPSVVFTFDPHPIQLLAPGRMPPQLSTLEYGSELLGQLGVDHVIAYPTDSTLLKMSPNEFFESIICNELEASGIVEGPNFYFGKNREGDVQLLQQLCDQACIDLEIVKPEQIANLVISSSAIRNTLQMGDVVAAANMLGRPYRLSGTVVEGERRGRTIGFPTANMADVKTLIPADGVYAGRVDIAGRRHSAAMNIGPNPTFGDDAHKLEVHVIDFDGDLYGQSFNVDLLERVRPTQSFGSRESLVEQLAEDVLAARLVNEKLSSESAAGTS